MRYFIDYENDFYFCEDFDTPIFLDGEGYLRNTSFSFEKNDDCPQKEPESLDAIDYKFVEVIVE